jgi:hypothetical protein
MTHGSRGKEALEDVMTGEGPMLAKHGAAEKDGIVQVPLIWACRSWPLESCVRLPTPVSFLHVFVKLGPLLNKMEFSSRSFLGYLGDVVVCLSHLIVCAN